MSDNMKPRRMNLSQMDTGIRMRTPCYYQITAVLGFRDLPDKWPISRCIICGRIVRPNTDDYCEEFIDQLLYAEHDPEEGFAGIVKVCFDHGGEEGREYIDALTGQRITVGKSPYLMNKLIKDWLREGAWLFGFIIRKLWYQARSIAFIIRHPMRHIRWIRHAKSLWPDLEDGDEK